MISSRVLQLLFLVSSMTSQTLIKGMVAEKKGIVEGIAQKIEELPKELRYKIFSSALALRENPKYEVYKKFDIGLKVKRIVLNGDNTRVLIGLMRSIALLLDTENGTVKVLKGHRDSIPSVALSVDGTLALTGSYDGTARVWNTDTGETIKILEVGASVNSVALSANGALALIADKDKKARLYNTSTGEILIELKGHTGPVRSAALSADGTLALTGYFDGTARVGIQIQESFLKPFNQALLLLQWR